jgi:hypothetical protein
MEIKLLGNRSIWKRYGGKHIISRRFPCKLMQPWTFSSWLHPNNSNNLIRIQESLLKKIAIHFLFSPSRSKNLNKINPAFRKNQMDNFSIFTFQKYRYHACVPQVSTRWIPWRPCICWLLQFQRNKDNWNMPLISQFHAFFLHVLLFSGVRTHVF